MGEKGLETDPGVVGAGAAGVIGGAVPGGATISAVSALSGVGQPGGGASSAAYARGGARQTQGATFGERGKGLGTDTGVVGTGVPDPGAGAGEASSDAGGLGGKSGTLSVSATPGGTAVGRGIGSPMGGSADRGTGAPDPGVVAADLNADGAADRTGNVQYRESSLE